MIEEVRRFVESQVDDELTELFRNQTYNEDVRQYNDEIMRVYREKKKQNPDLGFRKKDTKKRGTHGKSSSNKRSDKT